MNHPADTISAVWGKCEASFTSVGAHFSPLESERTPILISGIYSLVNEDDLVNEDKEKYLFEGDFAGCSSCPCLSVEQFYAVSMTGISSEADRVATISMGRNIDSNLTLILLMPFYTIS